jgi:hypothetical protein
MDSLAVKISRKAIKQALTTLPEKIDGMYDEAMARIRSQSAYDDLPDLANAILQWVAFARQPLLLRELRYALAVVPGETQVDEDNIPGVSLTDIYAGLVMVDKGTNLVRLVHYTAQEYFDRERERLFPLAESFLARTCMTYLLSLVDEDSSEKGWDWRSVSTEYPFLTYTICHW